MKRVDNLPAKQRLKRNAEDLTRREQKTRERDVVIPSRLSVARRLIERGRDSVPWQQTIDWIGEHISFWKFVPFVGVLAAFYFYVVAEPLYVSEAYVTLRSGGGAGASGVGALLSAASPFGGAGNNTDIGALIQHIESPEMLRALDKKFHLKAYYSSPDRWFWDRLSPDASWEDFLAYYQSHIEIDNNTTAGLLDIRVIDYSPERARAISEAVIDNSEKFMNRLNDKITEETLRSAKQQLAIAMRDVGKAQPYEQSEAENQLSAAQQALGNAQVIANQQQKFLLRVSDSTLPTESDRPKRLLDVLACILIASCLYVVGFLLWQNVLDHRRV